MKKRTVLLSFLLIFICLFGICFTVSADTEEKNRNYFYGMDHSDDQDIVDFLLSEQEIENPLFPGSKDYRISLGLNKFKLTDSNYGNRYYYLHYTRPELVGLKEFTAEYPYGGSTRRYVALVREDYYEINEAYKSRLSEVNAEIDTYIPKNATDLEKILIVHDYIASTTAYDKQSLLDDVYSYGDYDASGTFVDHLTVCQGYALAAKYLLNYLGIDCMVATSKDAGHAWNIVKLNGKWYHLDINSDDMAWDMLGRVGHTSMFKSTADFAGEGNKRNDFIVYPDDTNAVFTDDAFCVDTTYDEGYFWEDIYSQIYIYGDYFYYMGADGALYKKARTSDLKKGGELIYQPDEATIWHPYNIDGAFFTQPLGKIAGVGSVIYLITPKNVYSYDIITGNAKLEYTPTLSAQEMLIGLAYVEQTLYCTVNNNIPDSAETWIKVKDIPLPVKRGLKDAENGNQIVDSLSFSVKMGEVFMVDTNLTEITLKTDKESIAKAEVKNGKIEVKALLDGEAVITVNDAYTINVSVSKDYTFEKSVTLYEGDSKTIIDNTGLYADKYSAFLLDTGVATVNVKNISTPGQQMTVSSGEKQSSFKTGEYMIGVLDGSTVRYLTSAGGNTVSVDSAAVFTVSGNTDNVYISINGKYLSHSTSGISMSADTGSAAWKYGSNGFCFTSSRRILFWTTTTTYYLVYNNGFTVSTSASKTCSEYKFVPGKPGIEGRNETEIVIKGVKKGSTAVLIGETLYRIEVKDKASTQTVYVKTQDEIGETLKDTYEITGEIGTGYSIEPEAIYGYITPKKVSGTFTKGEDEIILVYTLNTDKTGLKAEIDNVLSEDGYTLESYSLYKNAVDAGKIVYNLERATQISVDNSLKAITDAKQALKLKAKGYVLDTDGFDSGFEYIITNSNRYAIGIENGSIKAKQLSVSENTIENVTDNYVWLVTKSASGFCLKNKSTGQYLTVSSSRILFFTTYSLTLSNTASYWSQETSGGYFRLKSSGRYLRYSGSNFSQYGSAGSNCNMVLYKK